MDEIEKNHLKTLIKARNYLLSQTPTDKASASRILSDADKIRHLIGPLGEIGRWPPK
jgi:hypothetical protein